MITDIDRSICLTEDYATPHGFSRTGSRDLFSPATNDQATAPPTSELLGDAHPGLADDMFQARTAKGDRAVTSLALQYSVIDQYFTEAPNQK